jgi:hypothetical protein
MRKYALYGAGLIALYLAVEHYTGFSKDATASASGGASIIKAFQGRG